MAQANFNDVVMEKFSGTEPEDDADAFVKQVEHKIKVTLGQLPAPGNDRENYLFRQRALFASLLRGPAAEWYAANINEEDAAHTWDFIKREFRTRFTDGRDRYRVRIQAENIKRTENEPIKTYLQRVKKIVDKGWPTIYVVGATAAQRTAADNQMQIHRNEKYISLGSKGLIPNSLKQCAYKRMLEHPNTSWEQLTTHLINKDLCYAMSADGEEHSSSNDKLVNIEKQLKSLQEALQSHSVNAVNLNPQNPRMNQNFTRFCKICRMEGHTVMYCPRKRNQSNFQNQNLYRPRQNNVGEYPNRNFRPFQRNQNQYNYRQFRPQQTSFQNRTRFPQNRNGFRNNFQTQQRNYIQNSYRQNYPGSNQNYSNQQNPQHTPFQNSNNEASQNQSPNVQYINEQDVTEQMNMIRHHPKRNSSQIQLNRALTYQAFRTGCNTLLGYIKGDLFQSTESLAHCVSADFAMRKGIAAEVVEKFPFLRNSALQFSFQPGTIFAYWHEESQRFIYNLVKKVNCSDKPNPPDVANAIEAMKEHALSNNVKVIAMPQLASGLDGLPWNEIQTMLLDIFWNSGIQIQVYYLPFSSQRPSSRLLWNNSSGDHSLYSLN